MPLTGYAWQKLELSIGVIVTSRRELMNSHLCEIRKKGRLRRERERENGGNRVISGDEDTAG